MNKITPTLITDLNTNAAVEQVARPRLIRSSVGPMALEQRFMFDGAAVGDAVHAVTSTVADIHVATDVAKTVSTDIASTTRAPDTAPLHMLQPAAAAVPDNVRAAQAEAERLVSEFLKRPDAREQLFTLFNGGQKEASAEWLKAADDFMAALRDGETTVRVELRSSAELQGAKGAFSRTGTTGEYTIYLNSDWLAGNPNAQIGPADVSAVTSVLVEELGHYLDSALNPQGDTAGDEGEAFAYLLANGSLRLEAISSLADGGTVQIEGQSVDVEFANFAFVNAYEMVYDLNNNGTIEGNRGETAAEKEQSSHNFNASSALGQVTIDDGSGSRTFSGNDVSATSIVVGGQTYYGWISRPIKANGIVRGFYFWTDIDFTSLALAQADGNQDGDSNVNDNRGFLLVVDQAWFDAQITSTGRSVSLNNAKDGNLGSVNVATVGSSSDRVDSALNGLLPTNSPPSAVADTGGPALEAGGAANATLGTTATGNVLTNDTDPNTGDTKAVSKVGTASADTTVAASSTSANGTAVIGKYGTLTIGADGSYAFVVDNSLAAVEALRTTSNTLTDTFTYTMVDSAGAASTTTLTITIEGANDKPVAANDSNTAKESLLLNSNSNQYTAADPLGTKATGNVLTNDTDVDRNGETKVVVGFSTDGFARGTANGTTTFSTTLDSGSASSIKNGALVYSLDASGNPNPTPLLDGGGNPVTVTGKSGSGASASLNFSSTAALAGLTRFAVEKTGTGYLNGTINSASTTSSTTLLLSNVGGSVSVGMTVTGTGLATAPAVTQVNYDGSGNVVSVTLDAAVTITNQDVNFGASASAGNTLTGQYGVLVLNTDGSYTYTPTANNPNLSEGQVATEVFTYAMRDAGGLQSLATLTINVRGSGTNDPNAIDDTATAVEASGISNGTAGINPTGNVLGANGSGTSAGVGDVTDTTPGGTSGLVVSGFTDSSGNAGTLGVALAGRYGSLTLAADGSYTYVVANGNADVQALRLSTDVLTETFVYTVTNNLGKFDSATLTITLQGANDAPVAADDSATATKAVGTGGAAVPGYDPSGNVLTNDSDVDDAAGALSITAVRTGASEGSGTPGVVGTSIDGLYGSLTLNADGSWTYIVDNNNPAVRALQAGQPPLTDSFNYTVTDGSGTGQSDSAVLNITIDGANDPISVNNVFVNEASPYAVFTVSGAPGVAVTLDLGNTTGLAANDAPASLSGPDADIGSQLQVLVGGVWVDYNAGSPPVIPSGGALLVRVAVNPDTPYEGNEAFTLTATTVAGGVASSGIGTINDDGNGDIYLGNNTTATPNVPLDTDPSGPDYPAQLDDDRPLSVDSIRVNEGSPYAVFTVTGVSGQLVKLSLTDGSALVAGVTPATDGSEDYGPDLECWDPTSGASGAWVAYTANSFVAIPTGETKLLVRTAIVADPLDEGDHTFTLNATNTGGTAGTGTATIDDHGGGTKYPDAAPTGTTPATDTTDLDDDRPLSVTGGNYNENSPRAVFTVTANLNQSLTFDVRDAADTGKAPTGDNEGNPDDSLDNAPIYYSLDGGATWVLYDGTPVIAGAVPVLVAVDIAAERDNVYEGEEQFQLVVNPGTPTEKSAFASIFDDGTGDITDATGANDPTAIKDDDRGQFVPIAPPPVAPPVAPPAPAAPAATVAPYVPLPPFDSSTRPTKQTSLPLPDRLPIGDILTSPQGYRVTVNEAPNAALSVYRGITDQFVEAGRSTSFNLPNDAFVHTRSEAILTVEVKLADGRPLPKWITFNPQSGSFTVTAPRDHKERLVIRVTVRDNQGHEATTMFKLDVGNGKSPVPGRLSLSEQLRVAGQRSAPLLQAGRDPVPQRAGAEALRART